MPLVNVGAVAKVMKGLSPSVPAAATKFTVAPALISRLPKDMVAVPTVPLPTLAWMMEAPDWRVRSPKVATPLVPPRLRNSRAPPFITMSLELALVGEALDAVALALFAITGTATASAHGVPALPAVLVGVVSAVGGGVLVSVLRGEVPRILQPSRPQALLAAAVGGTYLALAGWDANAAYVVSGALGVGLHLVVAPRGVRTRPLSAVA